MFEDLQVFQQNDASMPVGSSSFLNPKRLRGWFALEGVSEVVQRFPHSMFAVLESRFWLGENTVRTLRLEGEEVVRGSTRARVCAHVRIHSHTHVHSHEQEDVLVVQGCAALGTYVRTTLLLFRQTLYLCCLVKETCPHMGRTARYCPTRAAHRGGADGGPPRV